MKPILRHLHSPDVDDLDGYVPSDKAFSLLIQLMVGPAGGEGAEAFDVTVCSTDWVQQRGVPLIGRHHLIMPKWDYQSLVDVVNGYLSDCSGRDWPEVASKVGRLGRWEFEDYHPAEGRK